MNCANKRSELSLKRTDVKHPLPLVTLGLRWRNASRPTILASRTKNESRHAAALALVGWYLLAPPTKGPTIDATVPIAKWDRWGQSRSPFKTEKDCQNWQSRISILSEFQGGQNLERLNASVCLKDDDPRLKEK